MPGPLDVGWQDVTLDATRVAGAALAALLWVAAGAAVYRLGRRVLRASTVPGRLVRPEVAARAETARGLLLSLWKYVAVFAVVFALLAMLPSGVLPAAALVTAGGLIVALGVQSVFRDVVGGFSILVEGQYGVGDRVRFYGVDVEGTVEAVGLRVTVVRDDDGSRVYVPNGAITAVRNFAPARDERPVRGRRREPADAAAPQRPRPASVTVPDDAPSGEQARSRRRRRGGRRRATSGDAASGASPSGGGGASGASPSGGGGASGASPSGGGGTPPTTSPARDDAPAAGDNGAADAPATRTAEPREVLAESPWSIE